jgi:hypothetical protein
MASTHFSEITLPSPNIASPQFTEQVEDLLDAFDDIINSMLERLSSSSKKSVEEIQAEIDEMDDDEDDDDEDGDDDEDDDEEEEEKEEEGGDKDADTTLAETDDGPENSFTEASTHSTDLEEDPEVMDQLIL